MGFVVASVDLTLDWSLHEYVEWALRTYVGVFISPHIREFPEKLHHGADTRVSRYASAGGPEFSTVFLTRSNSGSVGLCSSTALIVIVQLCVVCVVFTMHL